jgi:hypothetical protein
VKYILFYSACIMLGMGLCYWIGFWHAAILEVFVYCLVRERELRA